MWAGAWGPSPGHAGAACSPAHHALPGVAFKALLCMRLHIRFALCRPCGRVSHARGGLAAAPLPLHAPFQIHPHRFARPPHTPQVRRQVAGMRIMSSTPGERSFVAEAAAAASARALLGPLARDGQVGPESGCVKGVLWLLNSGWARWLEMAR